MTTMDVLLVVLTILFFVMCGLYVRACDRMSGDNSL